MHTASFLPALVAIGAGIVSAQTSFCDQATITIAAAADATNIPCLTVEGSIKINEEVSGEISINGPRTIKGDLIVTNVTNLISLSSSSVASIGGTFQMQGLTLLSNLNFNSLTAVNTISWITLPRLSVLTFGTAGVTTVKSIIISDTFLSSLDGLNVVSVDTFDINNNKRLVSYTSDLANVTTALTIAANGFDLALSLPELIWVQELRVGDVASFEAPALQVVNGSLSFDKNKFTSFIAPNLTKTETGDISFTNNDLLTNISFPVLTETGGSITIQNNTLLGKIDGFPELVTIGGAVELLGNFSEVAIPKLNDLKGAFNVLSTTDIQASCDVFDKLEGREIQGDYTCKGNEENANSGGNSTGGGGSGNDDGPDGAAGMISVNLPAILVMAVLGGVAQMML